MESGPQGPLFLFLWGGLQMAKGKGGQNTVKTVEALVRPVIENMGLSLWDVRFEKEGPDWFLRIFIDKEGGLDMLSCEEATRAINPIIDKADPIDQSYFMEVGSPGLGRKLTREEHYTALQGQKIAARLIRPDEQGNRELEGILKGLQDGIVTLETEQGEVSFARNAASFVKLCDDEDLF